MVYTSHVLRDHSIIVTIASLCTVEPDSANHRARDATPFPHARSNGNAIKISLALRDAIASFLYISTGRPSERPSESSKRTAIRIHKECYWIPDEPKFYTALALYLA